MKRQPWPGDQIEVVWKTLLAEKVRMVPEPAEAHPQQIHICSIRKNHWIYLDAQKAQ